MISVGRGYDPAAQVCFHCFLASKEAILFPVCRICFDIAPYIFVASLVSDNMVMERDLPHHLLRFLRMYLFGYVAFILPQDNGQRCAAGFQNQNHMDMIGHHNILIHADTCEMFFYLRYSLFCQAPPGGSAAPDFQKCTAYCGYRWLRSSNSAWNSHNASFGDFCGMESG